MSFGKPPTVNQKAKKQELAEKVKEIKERQKNWLKQRDHHKKKEPTPERYTASQNNNVKEKTDHKKDPLVDSEKYSSKYDSKSPKDTSLSVQPKGKFKSWLDARNKGKSENEDYGQWIGTANTYTVDADVLQVDSSRSPGFATPDTDYDEKDLSHRTTGKYEGYAHRDKIESAEKLLSHQDFDALADSIVARVKNDLNIDQSPSAKTVSAGKVDSHTTKSDYRYTNHISENGKGKDLSNTDTSSHHCPSCQKLMTSPHNIPMIFIPCGHNICQSCCQERELCPSCGCPPSSKTCNIMLLQIIQDYHGKHTKIYNKVQNVNYSSRSYSPGNYKDAKFGAGVKSKTQYREEYHNLLTRQEVLKSEAGEVQGNIKNITQQLKREQKQIQNISLEEDRIREEVRLLQEKLSTLELHRKQYSRSKEELDQKKISESNRLNLIQDTLLTLEIEIEKVKLLAGEER